MPSKLLSVRGLGVRYRDGSDVVQAVAEVDLELAPGVALGLLGESGCGKTSLALALAGLLPAQAEVTGKVAFWSGTDEPVSLLAVDERAWRRLRGERIGLVFQQPSQSLSPYRRVGRQIADVLRAHGRPGGGGGTRVRVAELLAEVDLEPGIAASYPHQLSGGQLQRIVLCQALSCEPDLLLADEPTASLDSETEARILDMVERLGKRRGLALLWISHDPDVLARVTERLLVMHAGRIVERGATERVLAAPEHEFTRGLLASRPRRTPR